MFLRQQIADRVDLTRAYRDQTILINDLLGIAASVPTVVSILLSWSRLQSFRVFSALASGQLVGSCTQLLLLVVRTTILGLHLFHRYLSVVVLVVFETCLIWRVFVLISLSAGP